MNEPANPTDVLNGKCILLVEDDPDLQPQICELLKKYGAKVNAVGCYKEAENALNNPKLLFDAGIVDIRLPRSPQHGKKVAMLLDEWTALRKKALAGTDISGQEGKIPDKFAEEMDMIESDISKLVVPDAGLCLIKNIRNPNHLRSSLPILFLTGRQNFETEKTALGLKPAILLVKPQRAAAIIGAVADLLRQSQLS